MAKTLEQWGQIDILVNNAGDIRDALLTGMTDEQWDFVIDLNLKGTFLCTRAVVSHDAERLRQDREHGIHGLQGNVGQANYSAASSGVVGLTRATGLELARYGINVNCIAPARSVPPNPHAGQGGPG